MEQWQYLVLLKAITEANIETLGMQAENMQRQVVGSSMAYDDQAFAAVADRLNAIWEANRP